MATKTTVIRTDDLDGTESEDVHAVEFSIDGADYTIDLTDENHDGLLTALRPYLDVAQVVKPARGKAKAKSSGRGASRDRAQSQAIREWGRQHGYTVPDRGRIPGEVVEAYNQVA